LDDAGIDRTENGTKAAPTQTTAGNHIGDRRFTCKGRNDSPNANIGFWIGEPSKFVEPSRVAGIGRVKRLICDQDNIVGKSDVRRRPDQLEFVSEACSRRTLSGFNDNGNPSPVRKRSKIVEDVTLFPSVFSAISDSRRLIPDILDIRPCQQQMKNALLQLALKDDTSWMPIRR
jgi:hypothetical protein